ncbi:MAG TPA: hypothetical protein VHV77_07080 [Pirellulales bacterium]|nr:hypothetical protein [Pirellulales bacterium]
MPPASRPVRVAARCKGALHKIAENGGTIVNVLETAQKESPQFAGSSPNFGYVPSSKVPPPGLEPGTL